MRAFFDSGHPVRIKYRFGAPRKLAIRVEVIKRGSGRVVRSFTGIRRPGRAITQRWAGRTGSGAIAPEGRYRVTVGPLDGHRHAAGRFTLRGHIFPVRGDHGTRGPIGEFGAPRSGGRIHEGFDITASCGSPLVAARGGRVLEVGYDPVLYGNYVLIHGRGEDRSYFYAHLRRLPLVGAGQRVRTGTRVGAVGQTGNAATTPCHLHFEVHRHDVPIDPAPSLTAWAKYS